MDLIDYVVDCYNNNNFDMLIHYLSDDCVYRSQWVFDEMVGKENISEYLVAKSNTIAKAGLFPQAEKVNIISPLPQEAIAIKQGDEEVKVILLLGIKDEKIISFDLCMPGLFEY